MDNIFTKVFLLGLLAGGFWLMMKMLMGIPWDQFSDAALFVKVGYLMEALFALAGMGGACFGAYVIIKR